MQTLNRKTLQFYAECIRQMGVCWQTLYVIILTLGLYSGITTKSFYGAIGTILFVGVCTFALEAGLYSTSGFKLNKIPGIILVVIAVLFDFFAVIFPEAAFSRLGLSFLSGVIILVYAIVILKNYHTFPGRVSGLFMALGLFAALLYCWQNMGCFSPDSHSYYEISQTFTGNFGFVDTIRQYVIRTDYNISFPYFYPLCLFFVDGITKLGRYAGVLFNFYIMLFTGLLFLKISRCFVKRLWCGAIAAFLLFTTDSYLDELCAARSIPLVILLTAICAALCVKIYLSPKKSNLIPFAAGLCAGMVMTTRFDGMVLVAYCALLMLLVQKERRTKTLFCYLAGALVFLLPWMIYSLIHFQSLWISDNLGTMFLVETTVPNRVSVPGEFTATLFNSPKEWLIAFVHKAYAIAKSLIHCSITADMIVLLCLIVLVLQWKAKRISFSKIWFAAGAFLVFYAGKTFMYALVGYEDTRYHVESAVLVTFLFLLLCEVTCEKKSWKNFRYLMPVFILGVSLFQIRGIVKNLYLDPVAYPLVNVDSAPDWVMTLDAEMESKIQEKDAEILYLGNGFDEFTFGDWTDWKIYVVPTYATWSKVNYAMHHYMEVDYVILPKETALSDEIYENLQTAYRKIELKDYWLFEV